MSPTNTRSLLNPTAAVAVAVAVAIAPPPRRELDSAGELRWRRRFPRRGCLWGSTRGWRYQAQAAARPSGFKVGCSWGSVKGTLSPSSSSRPCPSDPKGKITKRVHFDRNLIRKVAGFVAYEKRVTELLKVGKDKRALKVAKKKLGTQESQEEV